MKPLWRWLIVAIYVLTLPFMRRVWELLRAGGVSLANAIPLLVGALLVVILAIYLVRIKKEKRPWVYISFLVICVVYALVTSSLERPIERIHLAQYGLLSILVFWAMARGDEGMTLCLWSILATVELGLVDECVQGLLPPRIYDFNDLLLNAKAALLGQAVMAFVLRPWERRAPLVAPARRRLAKTACALMALALTLIVLLTVINICLIERGTPTISEDVHRGDGKLKLRDGFLYFGAGVIIVNAAVVAAAVIILILTRSNTARAVQYARAVIICGLLTPAILIVGKLIGLRFR